MPTRMYEEQVGTPEERERRMPRMPTRMYEEHQPFRGGQLRMRRETDASQDGYRDLYQDAHQDGYNEMATRMATRMRAAVIPVLRGTGQRLGGSLQDMVHEGSLGARWHGHLRLCRGSRGGREGSLGARWHGH